jgi:GNAT superfamily N-acetyltransferase
LAQAGAWPAERWAQQVRDFATFVAVVDGTDVGVVRGAVDAREDVRELISLWVAPGVRRQGVGARLIEVVGDWARAEGAGLLVLDVVEGNVAAIAAYARGGFARVASEAFGGQARGEIRMVKPLAAPAG